MAVLRSMTGFARVRRLTEFGEFVVTLKSVNHRGLDVHLHLPADLDLYEHAVRALIKTKVSRGHVELRLGWGRTAGTAALQLNIGLFQGWMAAFEKARSEYGITCEPNLNDALRIPGMLSDADRDPDPALEAILLELAAEGVDAFNSSREKEGAALAKVILEANSRILEHSAMLASLRARALPLLQERTQERLSNLLSGVGIEPQRLIQEAAILADRSDITEEIHRLSIHSKQLAELVNNGGETGKKLDFLMQEMGRETNTILSKTSGAGELGLRITDIGIAVKAEIERIREQALNLE